MFGFYRNLLSIFNSKPWTGISILLYLRFMSLAVMMCLCPCLHQNISGLIFHGVTSVTAWAVRTWFPIKHYSD